MTLNPDCFKCIYSTLNISETVQQDRQEARLWQRDRATIRSIEYFAKSLKVTQVIRNGTVE